MAKSQQTFNKSEKEKKRLKKREYKRKKMEARRAAIKESGSKGIQFAYVDHNGQLTDTPPDPTKKIKIKAENITIGTPKMTEADKADSIKSGKVSFFDSSKGFGFIIDSKSQEKYFTHVSGIIDSVKLGDEVTFELEKGMKGMNAVRVRLKNKS